MTTIQLLIACSDGVGGDYADGAGCDTILVTIDEAWILLARNRHKIAQVVELASRDSLDEIRFHDYSFSAYRQIDIDPEGEIEASESWQDDKYAFVDLDVEEMGIKMSRTECDGYAINAEGNMQFHFLPRHGDCWIHSGQVSLADIEREFDRVNQQQEEGGTDAQVQGHGV